MTPVILLTDGYIANGAEPWRIPDMSELKPIEITHPAGVTNGDEDEFLPYARNEKLARPWAIPGTPGLQHRVGGLQRGGGKGGKLCFLSKVVSMVEGVNAEGSPQT